MSALKKKLFIPGKRYTSGSIVYVANNRGDLIRVTPKKRDLRAHTARVKEMRKVAASNTTTPSEVEDGTV